MSLRPAAGRANPGRGGDGRRRRWSESPIPRAATRRVRMAGNVGTTTLCASEEWVLTSSGDTFAVFTGSLLGFVSCAVSVSYDCTYSGDVDVWVADVTVSGGATDLTPTTAGTVSGPELAGSMTFYSSPPAAVSGSGNITMIRIEWDIANAFTGLCAVAIDYT